MTTLDPSPRVHVTPADAEKVSFLRMDLYWLVTREMSAGAFTQFLHVSPPGTGVPMHTHLVEDESLYVIEGEVVGGLGDSTVTCRAGDALMLPHGEPHGWRVIGEAPARLLFTVALVPDTDWESMFQGLVGLAPTDFAVMKALCARNRIEFVDPPTMP